MENVFYFHKINAIGGVESFFYYLSQVYKNMVVYYKEADPLQIERLAKNIEVRKYKEPIKCDRFFCNYGYDIKVDAKDYYHMVHYDAMNVGFTPMVNEGFKYIGVSKLACKSFEEKTGKKCELIYNVVPIKKKGLEKYKDKIHLISITRLSSEKGGDLIEKLSKMLDKFFGDLGIEYVWTIYTNKIRYPFTSPNIEIKPQSLNIHDEVEKSHWLVQLSKCESFGLSVCEALILGTPVIITDLEAFKEIGCKHGVNACICNMDLSNVDLELIRKGIKDFKYTPPKSNWGKYLNNETNYNPNDLIKVKPLRNYTDIVLDKYLLRSQEYEMTKARASYLEAKGLVEVLYGI